jgi:glycosyltransferase involved in cell wall biosynthesis
MNRTPSILTNLAFHQSRVWSESVATICREGETPDVLGAFRQAFRLLRLRPRFDAVVTMGPRPSLAYGLLCGLLRLPSKQILTEVFLDPPRTASCSWRVKTALFRWIARRSLGVLTNSSAEVDFLARRFGLPADKLRFVPMYTTIEHPERSIPNDGYILSIGRTLRDLDTLLQAASRFDAPLVLVIGKQDVLPCAPPSNVRVFRDISLEEGHALLSRAALVAIPLLPAERSTGQVVLFEAMAMGKPVVATRVAGTTDYIRDGENGLLVDPEDAPALATAVNRIAGDPLLAERLAAVALAECKTHLSPDSHAVRKLDAIRSLWTRAHFPGESSPS